MTMDMNFMQFSDMWDSALKSDSREAFVALWSKYNIADAFTLDTTYDMAYGGVRRIRAIIELSQISFSEQYEIPRRSLEDWEAGKRIPPSYTVKMLGYSVLSDVLALRKEFKHIHDAYALTDA